MQHEIFRATKATRQGIGSLALPLLGGAVILAACSEPSKKLTFLRLASLAQGRLNSECS